MVKTAIYTYPWDYLDEGTDVVLDRFKNNGIDGVYVALKYHTAEILLPHSPKRKIYFPTPGAIYFKHDPKIYENSLIKPVVSPVVKNDNFNALDVLRSKTKKKDMGLYAWVLGFHSTEIGQNYPSASITNAFGDKLEYSQCPSNPDAVEYFINIVLDITSNYDVDKILLESVESLGIYHGFHHEMFGVPFTPAIAFFLGLCFCPYCIKNAEKRNIDVKSIKYFVQNLIDVFFIKGKKLENESWESIRNMVNGEMGKYLEMRQDINADIHKQLKSTIRKNSNCDITVLDFGPMKYSYYLGPDDNAWENGVNFEKIKNYIDNVVPTFYKDNLNDFEPRYEELKKMVSDKTKIGIAFLALEMPGSATPKNLKEYLKGAVDIFKNKPEIEELSFYNYSLMSLETLELIKNLIK